MVLHHSERLSKERLNGQNDEREEKTMEEMQKMTVKDVLKSVWAELRSVRIPVGEIRGTGEILERCCNNIGACIEAMEQEEARQARERAAGQADHLKNALQPEKDGRAAGNAANDDPGEEMHGYEVIPEEIEIIPGDNPAEG